MSRLQRQVLALVLIVASAAALYWAQSEWLIWGLMALTGAGMLISIPSEGDS